MNLFDLPPLQSCRTRFGIGCTLLFALILSLSACTDYESDYEEMYGYMAAGGSNEDFPNSSSNVILSSSSEESSSGVASSSTTKSSSSVASVVDPTTVVKGTMTDARDNQTYKTVTIGSQTWMAENLNYDYNEGTARSYCYDNSVDSCAKYGRLYQWSAAMDSAAVFSTAGKGCGYGKTCYSAALVRGVCPKGWHLPNDNEWNTLFTAVGGSSTAGTKLKSANGWSSSGNGTDSFGFTVLPAGYRYNGGDFYYAGRNARFWKSSEYGSNFAYELLFVDGDECVDLDNSRKDYGFSVRCLRDSTDEGSEVSSSSSSAKSGSSVASSSSAKSSSSVVSSSSSSVILSSSGEESGSSIASSSSAKSSSSVASSSSAKSSSSVVIGYTGSYGTLTDSRDNQTYKTVTIGTQTWMAENLNYDYNEGTAKSYCYNNSADSCAKYGRLYLWSAAMDSAAVFGSAGKDCGYGKTCSPSGSVRGICPEGWHLPSKDEWQDLFDAVGGTDVAGEKLKSTSGWNSSGNGTDSFGFAVLSAGNRQNDGSFGNVGGSAFFWSSTEFNSSYALGWFFRYYNEYVYPNDGGKYYGFSVRCLRNLGSNASSSSSVASSSIASSSSANKNGYDVATNTLTDARDNQTYKTVTIGTQTWMAENLNYAYNEGTAKSYCYNNSADSCAKYGRLYLWSAAMDSAAVFSSAGKGCGDGVTCASAGSATLTLVRGVCPEGWHLPKYDEWNTLFDAVGGTSIAGTKLKSTSGWFSGSGKNSFGFAVLPAGHRDGDGNFSGANFYADFWSSTEYVSRGAFEWSFDYHDEIVYQQNYNKNYGYSVRCLLD